MQYLLSADDFGVMRGSAVTLQSDNDALDAKRGLFVQRALDQLVTVGLIHTFEHQKRTYVYQRDWQDWQKVEWPRATIQPKPNDEALDLCKESTRRLFEKHPGGASRKIPKSSPSHLGVSSQVSAEPSPSLAGARPRGTAMAKANKEETDREIEKRAGWLLNRYAELFYEHRKGAKYHNRMHLDFPKACELVHTWDDDARLEKLAILILTTDDDWISKTDRGFAVFAARASWADDRLAAWESEQARKVAR